MWRRHRFRRLELFLFTLISTIVSSASAMVINVATTSPPVIRQWTDSFGRMVMVVLALAVLTTFLGLTTQRKETGQPDAATSPVAQTAVLPVRQRWLLALGAAALAAGLAVCMWLTPDLGPQERLSVVLVQTGFAVLAWLVAWWAVRARAQTDTPAAPAIGEDDITTRTRILQRVQRWWIVDGLHRSLQHAARLEVQLDTQPDAVEAYEAPRIGPLQRLGTSEPLPDGTKLSDVYGQSNRLLLIGEPGSGKTTHLLQLTEDLLKRAQADGAAPTPVVLLLSRWRASRPDFCSWASAEIGERYGVSSQQVRKELDRGGLVLLLDGLDEVGDDYQDACLQAINSFARSPEFVGTGLVLTCRTENYQRMEKRLALDAAFAVRPLTRPQITRALRSAGPDLNLLRHAVDHDNALRDLLTTPLMLGVAIIAYRGAPAEALPTGDDRQYSDVLYRLFVHRMLVRPRSLRGQAEQAEHAFTPDEARYGLVWLARLMSRRSETVFYPDWLTPAWLPGRTPEWPLPKRRGVTARLARVLGWDHTSTGLVGGGLAALVGAFAIAPFGALVDGIRGALVTAVIAALFFGLGIAVTFGVLLQVRQLNRLFVPFIGKEEDAAYAASNWIQSFRSTLTGFLFWAIFGAVVIGVPVAVAASLPAAALISLTLGIGGGISGGSIPDPSKPPASPGQGLQASMRRFTRMVAALMFIVIALLAVVLVLDGPWFAVVAALPMTIALMVTAGPGRAWLRNRAVTFGLARSGLLPTRLLEFLSYADDRVIMQRVFGGYAFIHRTLRDYLADQDPTDDSPVLAGVGSGGRNHQVTSIT
ncbi:hypothetical protein GCM10027290_68320 [Micromonospora sonneratiae]|uniref:NACHT domain-containing protein n=1 Tax=Micromonospora sonneratiae TaxID=1184706 RepID=A0ABW3YRX7_9ACTN